MSSTTPTTETPSEAPAPASEGGGGWLQGVKKAAIDQYDNFKAKDPDTAAKLEGALNTVTTKFDDFSLTKAEKEAVAKMNQEMAKLEADYQAAKKLAHDTWLTLKGVDASVAADVRVMMQEEQEKVAQAQKTAIANMQVAIKMARNNIQVKATEDYKTAKAAATAEYDRLVATSMQDAAKIEAGMTDAETKLAASKQSCTLKYHKVLADTNDEIAALKKEAAAAHAALVENAPKVIDAAKASATKTAAAVKARSAEAAAAAKTEETVLKSEMEQQWAVAAKEAYAECDKLQALDAAKAEEIEKKIRDAQVKIAAAKASALQEYHQVLKEITQKLQKMAPAKK